jgi:hypothetical protein
MKYNLITLIATYFYFLGMLPVQAADAPAGKSCTPTNIAYCKKGKTWRGETYKTYTVRCSDSAKRTISFWKKRKQWCLGKTPKNCARDRLTAATIACRKK